MSNQSTPTKFDLQALAAYIEGYKKALSHAHRNTLGYEHVDFVDPKEVMSDLLEKYAELQKAVFDETGYSIKRSKRTADYVAAPGWRPIETAPTRTNKDFLVWDDNTCRPHIAYRNCYGRWVSDDDRAGELEYPTHWQPLPPPPKEATNEKDL